jgi:hypothetical protein
LRIRKGAFGYDEEIDRSNSRAGVRRE